MDSNDFISTDEIIAEASEYINDSDFTHGVGKSFYELIVHRAIEKLALATFYQKVTKDIFNWNSDGNGLVAMPRNLFNVREMYIFNSSCDNERNSITEPCECCTCQTCWTSFQEVHWKRTFNKFGSSGIKTSKITSFQRDPVYLRRVNVPSNLYYFGIQNGVIALSDNCSGFKNLRIVANGFGTDNCELPIIPRALREVCVNMCIERATYKMKFAYPEYRTHWMDSQRDLYGDNTVQNPGSWLSATRYVVSLNSKQRNDMFEYFGNIDIK